MKEYRDGRILHTKAPRERLPVEEYLKKQGRVAHLFEPERDETLRAILERSVAAIDRLDFAEWLDRL